MIEKVKKFFRNLFGTDNKVYLEAPKNENTNINYIESQNRNNEFQEQIKVAPDIVREKALRLQKDYKAGLIEEEDLSEEDFEILSDLYYSQIESTKQSIENYRKKILNIKTKLAQSN